MPTGTTLQPPFTTAVDIPLRHPVLILICGKMTAVAIRSDVEIPPESLGLRNLAGYVTPSVFRLT